MNTEKKNSSLKEVPSVYLHSTLRGIYEERFQQLVHLQLLTLMHLIILL